MTKKHDMVDSSGSCASLFWIGPGEGRTMEQSMKPDMELVSELINRKIKITDLLDFYTANSPTIEAAMRVRNFLNWYAEWRKTK